MISSPDIVIRSAEAKQTTAESVINQTVVELSAIDNDGFEYIPLHEKPLPSVEKLAEVVNIIRELIFPGYFGTNIIRKSTLKYVIGGNTERLFELLSEQIHSGLCFELQNLHCEEVRQSAQELTLRFIQRIPEIRRLLKSDVKATFDGDPAARSFGEIIYCYPSIRALINHRVAHELLQLDVPLIPRIISELAHSETGIDINPGAQIGESFCIDHGTGVVIGETCVIGNNVKLYQGVTLGAKRFSLDEKGNPINEPRHPIIGNNVAIYSNATILGRIEIGDNSVIGGNVWLTNSVPPNSKVLQKASENRFNEGLGI